jgi:hypothetical protein
MCLINILFKKKNTCKLSIYLLKYISEYLNEYLTKEEYDNLLLNFWKNYLDNVYNNGLFIMSRRIGDIRMYIFKNKEKDISKMEVIKELDIDYDKKTKQTTINIHMTLGKNDNFEKMTKKMNDIKSLIKIQFNNFDVKYSMYGGLKMNVNFKTTKLEDMDNFIKLYYNNFNYSLPSENNENDLLKNLLKKIFLIIKK